MAVPTVEHFVPLIYIAGASNNEDDDLVTITEGLDGWGISMRSIAYISKKNH